MDNSQAIKNILRAGAAAAKAHYLKAQNGKLPADPAAALDACEEAVSAWQDHPDLPQKERVQRLIKFARRALKDGDDGELKSLFLEIEGTSKNYHSDVWTLKKINAESASIKGGALGGKKSKIRQWAVVAAELLVRADKVGKTREQLFKSLPPVMPYLDIKTDQDDWKVYREGEKVFAINQETTKESDMTKRQFMDAYLSQAIKTVRSKPR